MLRKRLPWLLSSHGSSLVRSFSVGLPCSQDFNPSLLNQHILEALDSKDPMSAYPMIQRYRVNGTLIPRIILRKFFDFVEASKDPFKSHLFAALVTVDQIGKDQFPSNVEKVIRLMLAQRNWESCISFINEVELVNSGEIQLSYDTLELLIMSAKWHGDAEMALQALKLLHNTYSNVYVRTWGLVFQLLLDAGEYDGLKWIHKIALVPGLLVADDASYLRLATIAAHNGDLRMCEWASLRMRRRQRALNVGDNTDSLKLYILLAETAARSSIINADQKLAAGFQAVCRYLYRLGPLAGQVKLDNLPLTVEALTSDSNYRQLYDLFEGMCTDPSVCKETKALVFNLLLSAEAGRAKNMDSAMALAHSARAAGIDFNEDSILEMLQLASNSGCAPDILNSLASQCPTPRVLKRAKRSCEDSSKP